MLVIELGVGTAFPTVRRFGERVAKRFIRINPGSWQVRGGANENCESASRHVATGHVPYGINNELEAIAI